MKSERIYDAMNGGEPFEYIRVADRLPEFLKAYPPHRFGIESELIDLPKQANEGAPFTVVKTTMTDFELQRVIATAHAAGKITTYKELEAVETASLQRLMARLGWGGDVLATDELKDFGMQGLQTAPTGSDATPKADIPSSSDAKPEPSFAAVEVRAEDSVNTEELPVAEATEETAESEDDTPEPAETETEAKAEAEVPSEAEQVEDSQPEASDEAPKAESDDSGEEAPSPAPSKGETPKAKSKDAKAMDHYRRQIENIAKRKGIDPAPFLEYETKEEAQEILKKLFKGDVA